jgi:hypothetical protein
VRAIGAALGIRGREEKQRPAFDEAPIVIGELIARQHLDQPVGELSRLELVLQLPRTIVIHGNVAHANLQTFQ